MRKWQAAASLLHAGPPQRAKRFAGVETTGQIDGDDAVPHGAVGMVKRRALGNAGIGDDDLLQADGGKQRRGRGLVSHIKDME